MDWEPYAARQTEQALRFFQPACPLLAGATRCKTKPTQALRIPRQFGFADGLLSSPEPQNKPNRTPESSTFVSQYRSESGQSNAPALGPEIPYGSFLRMGFATAKGSCRTRPCSARVPNFRFATPGRTRGDWDTIVMQRPSPKLSFFNRSASRQPTLRPSVTRHSSFLRDSIHPNNIGNLTTEPSFCIVREFASCVFYSRATTSGSLRRPAGGRPRGSGGSTPFRAWASPKQVPSQIAVSWF